MIAKPSNNYCQVCRESYEDYLKVIPSNAAHRPPSPQKQTTTLRQVLQLHLHQVHPLKTEKEGQEAHLEL